jgi:hypothetical protein
MTMKSFIYNMMIILFKILLILFVNQNSFNRAHGTRCLIQNKEYLEEYLYKSDVINDQIFFSSTANLYPFDKVKNFIKVKWSMLQENDGTYYIKNEDKRNPFLCASDLLDPFKKRRPVYMSNNNLGRNCKWELTKVTNDLEEKEYYIRNARYGKQLYAESFFFKSTFHKRNIYLRNDKNKLNKSNRFKWIILCSESIDLL